MKKISLIAAAVIASLSLAACGNSASQHKAKRANSSSKVVHHKHHKKQQHKKKAASSSSSSSSSVSSSSNQQQPQQAQQTQQSQSGNSQLPPATDLHDFVNKYGESPAAYLMEHNGMSQSQALNSVPTDMKTSGEIQATYAETGQQ